MDALTAARAQMEVSLAFHMVFAALGICLPLLMVIAEGLWLRTRRPHYLRLAKQWAKATALLFAIGAVSGTALSFELGLLWPRFMAVAGSFVGPAFALEGYAFFVEAIFIGLYLYGWDRLSPRAHWLAGIPIAVSGALSAVFVVATNAWMQAPVGFEVVDGELVPTTALAAFQSPFWLPMTFHTLVSCYVAAAWAVAAVYAVGMLKGRKDAYHRSGLEIAMAVAVASTLLLGPSGDLSARAVAELQPVKFAAMEALLETERGAAFTIGGWPDVEEGVVRWAIRIPWLLSFLATGDPAGEVLGLDAFPREVWPNVALVHLSFQVMFWSGVVLAAVGAWFAWAWWRDRDGVADRPLLLRFVVVGGVLGYVGVETGWIVTEAGRQPWTIYGVMLTRDAVTSADGVVATFVGFFVLYVALGAVLVALLRYLARHPPKEAV